METMPETSLSSEIVVQTGSVKEVFLTILQNPQENTCVRSSFLIKLLASAKHLFYRTAPGDCLHANLVCLVF